MCQNRFILNATFKRVTQGSLEPPILGIEVYAHLHYLLDVCFCGGQASGVFQSCVLQLRTKEQHCFCRMMRRLCWRRTKTKGPKSTAPCPMPWIITTFLIKCSQGLLKTHSSGCSINAIWVCEGISIHEVHYKNPFCLFPLPAFDKNLTLSPKPSKL